MDKLKSDTPEITENYSREIIVEKQIKKQPGSGQQQVYSVENRKNMTPEELLVSIREKIQKILKK